MEVRKIFELNENDNPPHENLWDTAKAILRQKFKVLNAYIKKEEKPQINSTQIKWL